MEALLVITYCVFFSFLLYRLPYFSNIGLGKWFLVLVFLFKVGAGYLYGAFHNAYHNGGDPYLYVFYGKVIFDTFSSEPLVFLELVLGPNARPDPERICHISDGIPSWNDVRTYSMFRINALLHFFSGGYYYVHSVFFNFFCMIGLVGIYRVAKYYFPCLTYSSAIIVFCIPSVLFWGSGIHKGAICFLSMGLMLYQFHSAFIITEKSGKKWMKRFLLFALGFGILILVRPHLLLALFPAILVGWICSTWKGNTLSKFSGIYTAGIIGILLAPKLWAKADVIRILSETNWVLTQYFKGTSDVYLPTFKANFWSMMEVVPYALFNTLVRPLFNFSDWTWQQIAAAELFLMWVVVFASIWSGLSTNWLQQQSSQSAYSKQLSFRYFCLFFPISFLLMVGLTSDNMGALVRYRSLVWPFLGMAIFLPSRIAESLEQRIVKYLRS